MVRVLAIWGVLVAILATMVAPAGAQGRMKLDPAIEARIGALLARMTLEEKVGQLNLVGNSKLVTPDDVRSGRVGLILNLNVQEEIAYWQGLATQSRLGIPLLLGNDVLHGYRTIFPVPLAEASSFNPALAEEAALWAAREASAMGTDWIYAPMLDVGRDARWGRVVEGPGEDPFLAARMAAAKVRGLRAGGVLVGAKHFAGYGAVEGGRDFDQAPVSEALLRDVHLPPFRAAIEAGAESLMAAFSAVDAVPATASRRLLVDILRREWGFEGLVFSDWDAVNGLVAHAVAGDRAEAARVALNAGLDVDMGGNVFIENLAAEVRAGRVKPTRLDEAVRRVLRLKFAAGLFERKSFTRPGAEALLVSPEARDVARRLADESIVLLKNAGDLLPIRPEVRRLAVIGGFASQPDHVHGPWGAQAQNEDAVSILEGLRARAGADVAIDYVKACHHECLEDQGFAEAEAAARAADLAIVVLGEFAHHTGEAASRAILDLPGRQNELLARLVATGRPVVLVLTTGRPMPLVWADTHVPAIVQAFYPGSEGGHAVAGILFGDVNPSAKMAMTTARSVGQMPIYYGLPPSGRPHNPEDKYTRGYRDESALPLYPFGHGLSYTRFAYTDLSVEPARVAPGGTVRVSVTLTNTGTRRGKEVVQLYTRDIVASRTRPLRELKGFDKIDLKPGESRRVGIDLPVSSLGFHDDRGRYRVEPGEFRVYVGGDSNATLEGRFTLAPR